MSCVKANSSIKAFELKSSTLFSLDFGNNTISLCLFFSFLIIDLYFLIHAVITKIFNSIAELVISMWVPAKAKAEKETHWLTVKSK